MPRKPKQPAEAAVPRRAARPKAAKKTAVADEFAPAPNRARCVVCNGEVAQFSTEELCWVCRRLKISAWRDIENQAGVQE